MAMRVLAGIVNITDSGPKSGSVTIGFNPHARIDGTVPVVEMSAIGPAGRFLGVPAKLVALRQINAPSATESIVERFTIDDAIDRDSLRIVWRGTGPAFTEEISYMIIGIVPDRRVIDPLPASDAIRARARRSKPNRAPHKGSARTAHRRTRSRRAKSRKR